MRISKLTIENCRSIESAELNGLSQLNVLIGRNNAGKSAFFRALWHVSQRLSNQGVPWDRTLRNASTELEFSITVLCTLNEAERRRFIEAQWQNNVGATRVTQLLDSQFLRQVTHRIATTKGFADLIHWESTHIIAEDGQWVPIYERFGDKRTANPAARVTRFDMLDPRNRLNAVFIAGTGKQDVNKHFNQWLTTSENRESLQRAFAEHLCNSFFFLPTRRSEDTLQAVVSLRLLPDGSNLPQALLRVKTNHDEQFDAIKRFIEGAVPDVGQLQTPMTSDRTQVGFRHPGLAGHIPLVDMGTGIQQLLMMALVLETTGEETSLFIEEPEMNLHPGAQRFLLKRLVNEKRQIFLTTHSAVFLDVQKGNSIYKIDLAGGRTTAKRIEQADELSEALRTIGVQNSDVLLSDAVLFVEGPSDREILSTIANRLGDPFERRQINVLPLGGTSGGHAALRLRLDTLQGISRAAPIPHRFVIDRDERTAEELQQYQAALGAHLTMLERRELENYLLDPRAVELAIRECRRRRSQPPPEGLSEDTIERDIRSAASTQVGTILLKRIWTATARMAGGPFPREMLSELQGREDDPELARRIQELISRRFNEWLELQQFEAVLSRERERLNADLAADPEAILRLAGGSDVLGLVFANYGLRYDKSSHGSLIASFFEPDDLDEEIRSIALWQP